MKTLIAVIASILLCCGLAIGQTQSTRPTLYTQIDTRLPSGTASISATSLRAMLKDMVASMPVLNTDGTPVYTGGSYVNPPWLSSLPWSKITGAPTIPVNFTDLVTHPSTLAGYGITDSQPLDADLTALAALSGTNTIYYRSGANTWTAVTIGSNLTFSGGTLSATGGGGGSGDMLKSTYDTNSDNIVDHSALADAAPWTGITGKPTTISGFGLTDAQPLDSDLTAIAALSTTSYARGVLALADAAAIRSYIGAGASGFSGAFVDLSGKPTTLTGYGIVDGQPLSSDLSAISALGTNSYGRGLLPLANAAAIRTYIGAGTSSFDGTFASLTSKPTTISGYGLTDAAALVHVHSASDITSGLLPVARGGTGTASPGIVAGTNVTVTGTWPNQTVNSTASSSGTVTTVSVTTANGVSGSVANPTTTPAITVSLGAVTPSSVATGALTISRTDLAGGTAIALGTNYFDTLSANRTLTFSGTPVEGSQTSVKFAVSSVVTLTFPSSKRLGEANSAITSLKVYPGLHLFNWIRIGAEYVLTDSVGILSNDLATTDPTVSNDTTQGYSLHSRWINTTTPSVWECLDATTGAAVWHQLDAATASTAVTTNAQTGTTYTLVAGDQDNAVAISNASSNTVTVPPNSSVPFTIGHFVMVKQGGAGSTTIAAGAGVTINSTGSLVIGTQGAYVTLLKTATNTWDLVGSPSSGGSGTVTSVGLTMPTGFSVGSSPVTGSGTIAVTTSLSGMLKGTGSAFAVATADTDYAAPHTSAAGYGITNGSTIDSWGTKAVPTGTVLGTSDTQTITGKSIVATQLTGTLQAGQFPALTGNVTTSAGSLSTTIASGVVTNTMLAGSIDLTSKVTNALPIANGGTSGTTVATAVHALKPATVALTESSGAVTIDCATSDTFTLTLNANLTSVTLSNFVDGQCILIKITNTASNYTVTFGNSIEWPGGSQPVQTVGVHKDVWSLVKFGSVISGSVVQNY